MPSILNSDDGVVSGTSGLKSTGGNDGLLNIQSNGSTIVAVTGSGISVTGTVSQTGVSTFAAGTASAPSITFTGDTNTGIFSPAADTIAFAEGGAEVARFDSSGNFMVGTTSPTTFSGFKTFEYVNSGGNAIQLVTGTGVIAQTISSNTNSLVYMGARSNHGLVFTTNDTERMRINAGAPILCLSGGNTTATGTGIAFPATQSASSDANTLDDYEEGSWTPAWSVSGGTITANSNTSGKYVKIGRVVYIWGYISYQSHTGSPTGALSVTGLPFAAGQLYGQQNYGGFFVHWAGIWTANPPTTGDIVSGGLSTINLARLGTNGYVAVNFADMNTSGGNHSQTGFFGQYQTS